MGRGDEADEEIADADSTGPIEVKNGTTTKVEMPPLVRFGSISGKVDTKLVVIT